MTISMGVPADSRYGQPVRSVREHDADRYRPDPFAGDLAPPSPFCVIDGKARKARGTDYCIGHLRQIEAAQRAAEAEEE